MIAPAVTLGAPLENTVVLGTPKFTRLNALKISVRNCTLIRSVTTVFLDERQIHVGQARPGQRSSSHIAESAKGREREGTRIKPVRNRIYGNWSCATRVCSHRTSYGRISCQVRTVRDSGVAVSRPARADQRGEWKPAQERADSVQLPATDQFTFEFRWHAVIQRLPGPKGSSYRAEMLT